MQYFFLLLFSTFFFSTNAQDTASFVCYNCENLFDTIYNGGLNPDSSFLPTAAKQWNSFRYRKKLNQISRVLTHAVDETTVAIGLVEVENRTVLEDLLKVTGLNQLGFEVVHDDGQDGRGIDCAVLLNTKKATYLNHQLLHIPEIRTRDILQVTIEYLGEEMQLVVMHLPSKRGGEVHSEPKRMQVVDYYLQQDTVEVARIVMGDFNANPDSPSLQLLGREKYFWVKPRNGVGTHCYQSHWDYLDNFFVKGKKGEFEVEIGAYPFLLNKHQQPFRTYLGNYYQGGYSDHLPIILRVVY